MSATTLLTNLKNEQFIRVWGRFVIFPLLVVFITGCALPPHRTNIDTSSTKEPQWLLLGEKKICSPGNVCRVGVAAGYDVKEEAIEAARSNAYASLVRDAFPIELRSEMGVEQQVSYQNNDSLEQGAAKISIQTKVRGRLKSAQVIDSYWESRTLIEISGEKTVYDAWVFVKIDEIVLANAYNEEVARAKRHLKKIDTELQDIMDSIETEIAPSNIYSVLIELYRRYSQDLIELPEIKETAGVAAQLRQLYQHIVAHSDLSLIKTEHISGGQKSTIFFRQIYDELPQAGVKLVMSSNECLEKSPTERTTNANGIVEVSLKHKSRLNPCEITIKTMAISDFSKTESIPALFCYAIISTHISVSGFEHRQVRRSLGDLEITLASSHPLLVSERSDRDPQAALVTLYIDVDFGSKRRVNGKVHSVEGIAKLKLLLMNSNETLISKQRRIKAIGNNDKEIASGLARNLEEFSLEILLLGLNDL